LDAGHLGPAFELNGVIPDGDPVGTTGHTRVILHNKLAPELAWRLELTWLEDGDEVI